MRYLFVLLLGFGIGLATRPNHTFVIPATALILVGGAGLVLVEKR